MQEQIAPAPSVDIVVPKAPKGKKLRGRARKEAEAAAKREAEAKGIFEILTKQAQGFEQIVNAANNETSKKNEVICSTGKCLGEVKPNTDTDDRR